MEAMEVAEPKVMTAETEATPTAEVEKDLLVMTITTCHDLSCICQVSANSTASKKCVSFICSFYPTCYPTRNLCQPVIQIVTRNHNQNDPNAANAIVPHDLGFVVDANHCSSNLAWRLGGMARIFGWASAWKFNSLL